MSYQLLEQPYNAAQIKAIQNIAGKMSGIVAVHLSDIIGTPFDDFMDILEGQLIGDNGILSDVSYGVVGNGLNDVIHIYVEGEVEVID